MNTNELNFAYKVRHALNENLENLPEPAVERLAAARKLALARQKKGSGLRVFAIESKLAGDIGNFLPEPISWLGRLSVALPLLVLVVGLVGIYQVEEQHRINEFAELDALVLSDELPLSAYLDHGFNAFLAKRGE